MSDSFYWEMFFLISYHYFGRGREFHRIRIIDRSSIAHQKQEFFYSCQRYLVLFFRYCIHSIFS